VKTPVRRAHRTRAPETPEGYVRFVASIPQWPAAKIPSWVPEGARQYVLWVEGMRRPKLPGDTQPPPELLIVQRLATDPRMFYVWKQLKNFDDALLWNFLSCACSSPAPIVTERDRAVGVKSMANVARICRIRQNDSRVQDVPGLAKALAAVADLFDADAREASGLEARWFVKNRIKDEEARAYVRMLSFETQRLFGSPMLRTVARTASVFLQGNNTIGEQQVKRWSKARVRKPPSVTFARAK